MNKFVRVGVGALIIKDETILMGFRLGKHGKDSWSLPGGHLEFGETPEECAIRETLEETGLFVSQVKRGPWINDYFAESHSHYITLLMIARYEGGEPEVKEKEKCKIWQWFPYAQLPTPLFLPIQTFLNSGYKFDDFSKLF
ncbi:MAG: NUDIX domain-containing protein [Chlamydiales bacterium]|nr:NUDIX domain-containing protein [Chlamydiales bacterium]